MLFVYSYQLMSQYENIKFRNELYNSQISSFFLNFVNFKKSLNNLYLALVILLFLDKPIKKFKSV